MYNQRRKKSVIRLEMDETTLTGSRLSKSGTDTLEIPARIQSRTHSSLRSHEMMPA